VFMIEEGLPQKSRNCSGSSFSNPTRVRFQHIKGVMRGAAILTILLLGGCGSAPNPDRAPDANQLRYHTPPKWTRPEMKDQHLSTIPSCLLRDDGRPVTSADDWYRGRRPELLRHWTRILGKLEPVPEDR